MVDSNGGTVLSNLGVKRNSSLSLDIVSFPLRFFRAEGERSLWAREERWFLDVF